MIRLTLDIHYPSLTSSEEERLRERVRQAVQPYVTQVCCSMTTDGVAPDYEGEYLRSSKLELNGTIKVV